MKRQKRKIKSAFVEGSRKSPCKNSGWFITSHEEEPCGKESVEILDFIPAEEGEGACNRKVVNLLVDDMKKHARPVPPGKKP
jgi:hypothetical protein